MNEWERWVQTAQSGDRTAFDRLVRRFQDYAVAEAYARLFDFEEAREVAQEAFLEAFRALPTLREPRAFPAWLRLKIARYCDRRTRRKPLKTVSMEVAKATACLKNDPARVWEAKERRALLDEALATLSEGERTAITLRYLGEHSSQEIADYLDISVSAIKKRLQRAKARLQERMLPMLEETLRERAPSKDARFAEYNALLVRLTQQLERNEDVRAAYLAHYDGYRTDGFGTKDDIWSSLTLHLVYADAKMDSLATGRREFVAQFGTPLLVVEAPQNAPDNGYYLMAIYDGSAGPYEVDWYWRPESDAELPTETLLLFDKIGMPISEKPLPWRYLKVFPPALIRAQEAISEAEKQADRGRNLVSLFWAMWMITARFVARNPDEERMGFVPFLRNLMRDCGVLIGLQENVPDAKLENEVPTPDLASKIVRLRELGDEMQALMPKMSAAGCPMPDAVLVPAYRFLEMVATGI